MSIGTEIQTKARHRTIEIERVRGNSTLPTYRWRLLSSTGRTIALGREVIGLERCVNSAAAFRKLLKDKPILFRKPRWP